MFGYYFANFKLHGIKYNKFYDKKKRLQFMQNKDHLTSEGLVETKIKLNVE